MEPAFSALLATSPALLIALVIAVPLLLRIEARDNAEIKRLSEERQREREEYLARIERLERLVDRWQQVALLSTSHAEHATSLTERVVRKVADE